MKAEAISKVIKKSLQNQHKFGQNVKFNVYVEENVKRPKDKWVGEERPQTNV